MLRKLESAVKLQLTVTLLANFSSRHPFLYNSNAVKPSFACSLPNHSIILTASIVKVTLHKYIACNFDP